MNKPEECYNFWYDFLGRLAITLSRKDPIGTKHSYDRRIFCCTDCPKPDIKCSHFLSAISDLEISAPNDKELEPGILGILGNNIMGSI